MPDLARSIASIQSADYATDPAFARRPLRYAGLSEPWPIPGRAPLHSGKRMAIRLNRSDQPARAGQLRARLRIEAELAEAESPRELRLVVTDSAGGIAPECLPGCSKGYSTEPQAAIPAWSCTKRRCQQGNGRHKSPGRALTEPAASPAGRPARRAAFRQ